NVIRTLHGPTIAILGLSFFFFPQLKRILPRRRRCRIALVVGRAPTEISGDEQVPVGEVSCSSSTPPASAGALHAGGESGFSDDAAPPGGGR
ncbi:Os08g0124651, partial [Oryza sativa Japonica Group]